MIWKDNIGPVDITFQAFTGALTEFKEWDWRINILNRIMNVIGTSDSLKSCFVKFQNFWLILHGCFNFYIRI